MHLHSFFPFYSKTKAFQLEIVLPCLSWKHPESLEYFLVSPSLSLRVSLSVVNWVWISRKLTRKTSRSIILLGKYEHWNQIDTLSRAHDFCVHFYRDFWLLHIIFTKTWKETAVWKISIFKKKLLYLFLTERFVRLKSVLFHLLISQWLMKSLHTCFLHTCILFYKIILYIFCVWKRDLKILRSIF